MKTVQNISVMNKIKRAGLAVLLLIASLSAEEARAQLAPLGATYFQNQYIANPAMAGLQDGLVVNLAARQQWSVLPGSPQTQSLTGEYKTSKKVGLGLNLYNDQAGLIKNTRVMGTYAYHLPLNKEGNHLSFGVSLGFMDERILNEDLDGVSADASLGKFADRETFVDGDFGVAYQSSRFSAQLALPHLKSFFKQEDAQGSEIVDRSSFFAATSYNMSFSNALDGMALEPKVCYRAIKGLEDIVDLGTNIALANNQVNVQAFYHSTQSLSVGMGFKAGPSLYFNGMYTSGTAALQGNTNGNFELNMRVKLNK